MKALTIDVYWAWAIVHGPKRVENRGWRTHYRGPLAIHAGLNRSRDTEAIAFLKGQGLELPSEEQIEGMRGKVLGVCDLAGVVAVNETSGFPFLTEIGKWLFDNDPFAFGPQCWILENVRPLDEPFAVRGQQGLWELPLAKQPVLQG